MTRPKAEDHPLAVLLLSYRGASAQANGQDFAP